MGAYTWLSDSEFELYSKVDDKDINEVFQQVRAINPGWFIHERADYIERFLRKPVKQINYTVYQLQYRSEVRLQMSCTTKRDVLNFLYGLNIGYNQSLTINK